MIANFCIFFNLFFFKLKDYIIVEQELIENIDIDGLSISKYAYVYALRSYDKLSSHSVKQTPGAV